MKNKPGEYKFEFKFLEYESGVKSKHDIKLKINIEP